MRFVFKPVAIGAMFDVVFYARHDSYRNPSDNTLSHLRNDATAGGWTGTIALSLTDRISMNGFYGTRRGINVGLAWNIVNP